MSVTVTFAPGIRAPLGSVTAPTRLPYTAWPQMVWAKAIESATPTKRNLLGLVITLTPSAASVSYWMFRIVVHRFRGVKRRCCYNEGPYGCEVDCKSPSELERKLLHHVIAARRQATAFCHYLAGEFPFSKKG